jgi:pyrroline-5-carboxylate reductase
VSDKSRYGKIGLIGSGVMGEAIVSGLIKSGICPPGDVTVSDASESRLDHMRSKYGVNAVKENLKVLSAADILVLAVKPDTMPELLQELGPHTTENLIVISIAAGVKLSNIAWFIKTKVVRAMPNICAQVGEGMTALAHTSNLTHEDMETVKKLFESVGRAIWVDESKMDAVTAISGSGPAYLFLVMEAMIQGGVECGLPIVQARELVRQTFKGAVTMVENGGNPSDLREKIMSPGGTTAAALHQLEVHGVRGAFLEAVTAAAKRSKELG